MTALSHIQELDQDADVFLFELSNYNLDNPTETFRFTNFAGVAFNGPYQAIPCGIDSVEVTSQGTQPQPSVTVADTDGTIGYLIDTFQVEGATLDIKRTKRRFLDGQEQGGLGVEGVVQHIGTYRVTRRQQHEPGEAVILPLANPMDIDNTKLPGRHMLTKCPGAIRYRGPYCGYAGTAMFTLSGQPTLDPRKDQCSKDLAACKLRFGTNTTLPFGGFPSLQRG